MLGFITRMGYHFRQKIGRKSAEIDRICKHVGKKMADGVPSAENEPKIGEFLPKIAIQSLPGFGICNTKFV